MNFEGGYNLHRGTQRSRDTAVFGGGELDRLLHGSFRNAPAAQNVLHFHFFKTFGMLFAPFSVHFDLIPGDVFAFLDQDRNNVGAGASAQGDQQ